ncbi:MAG TPA: hydrogenase expression/formation protein HypE [Bacteroidales bacterium]|nr:hydrogenase expression/formation protein HypE [Bacteroidales bacterium]HPS17878.1 hydrogenase expression/formation protein HypE [Bacteroidales bacterium]
MKNDAILLNHGSGGKMTHELIGDLFVRYFDNEILQSQTDSAILNIDSRLLAYTTDSYVVSPIFFPGGNIGKLAVCGTVNDISVSGATPLYLSCGFILEEGLLFSELETLVKSMAEEAKKANVKIVTGDTKVVDKGKCDKIFINTSGIGMLDEKRKMISFGNKIKTGDKIIVNGTIGDHGTAILCARNSIEYTNSVHSDCASLNKMIAKALSVSDKIKFMRDATRGGLATVLCELAEKHNLGVELTEELIPVQESVRGLCEVFGFDPMYMANEGKVVMIVADEDAEKIIAELRKDEYGKNAAIIGEITNKNNKMVVMNTGIGGRRIIDMLAGEQLPRIC